jgi:hypothetical protein
MTDDQRGKFVGINKGELLKKVIEYFYRRKLCGAWVDKRDTTQVYDHLRPSPHLTEGLEN